MDYITASSTLNLTPAQQALFYQAFSSTSMICSLVVMGTGLLTGAVPQRQLGNLVEVFLGDFQVPQTVGHTQAHDELIHHLGGGLGGGLIVHTANVDPSSLGQQSLLSG